jgi:2-polyprenyl-6-methoxyphenol hydroxylase-like FAD-dependent oxidoreductase
MDTDILIVGAGPTGLMLANQLGRRGIRAMIIDRHSGPAQQTRAIGVQARTLEIYAKLGVAARALELGARTIGGNIWVEGRHKVRLPIGDIGKGFSPFPFVFMLGQDDNELILGEKLRDWRMAVDWNTELVDLEQHSGHVTARLKQPDGNIRQIKASWVAGCDGAHSRVREQCGITFPGAPYEHVFFVADTVATGEMVPDELNVYLRKQGFHLFFPMRGKDHWRVIGMLPAQLLGRDDVSFADVVSHVRQAAGAALSFQGCHWFSTYRIHHRSASRFRDRRCFLLGDAAHIHSPMGAQGMNTGLQDAYNLAWKLALVTNGKADDILLESYEAERLPVAQRLLRTTDRAFMMVVADTWLAGLFRTWLLAKIAGFAMRRDRIRRLVFRALSQIGINYRRSPLSRNLASLPETAPQAGDRFPWVQLKFDDGLTADLYERLDDLRFNLIVVGHASVPAEARNLSGLVRAHVIVDDAANRLELSRAKIPQVSFYLLRPDGHVCLSGTRLEVAAISRYFADKGLRLDSARTERTVAPLLTS